MADSTTRLRALPSPVEQTYPPRRLPPTEVFVDPNVLAAHQRMNDMIKAEIDGQIARIRAEHGRWGWDGEVVLPDSGLCHHPIIETFDGIRLEYFCTRSAGHRGDHGDPKDAQRHGCLDAPISEGCQDGGTP